MELIFLASLYEKGLGYRAINCTAARLAHLGVLRSVVLEVVSSNLGWTNTQGLQITEENVLPLS